MYESAGLQTIGHSERNLRSVGTVLDESDRSGMVNRVKRQRTLFILGHIVNKNRAYKNVCDESYFGPCR